MLHKMVGLVVRHQRSAIDRAVAAVGVVGVAARDNSRSFFFGGDFSIPSLLSRAARREFGGFGHVFNTCRAVCIWCMPYVIRAGLFVSGVYRVPCDCLGKGANVKCSTPSTEL